MAQSPDLEEDSRKEVFEVAMDNTLKEDRMETKKTFDNGATPEEDSKVDSNGGAKAKGEEEATMPEELELAQRHPLDPHKLNFSELLPEALRPYPSFEGWFVRIWDPTANFSVAVIFATNYATDESQVTLLFARGKNMAREGGRDAINHRYTYVVDAKTKDAKFLRKENDEQWGDDKGERPEGFEWGAPEIGRFVVTPHNINLDFTVKGYHFKDHLTKEDAHKSEKGPKGWACFVTIIPTHWYVYSLGSTVDYTFSNPEKNIHHEGSAHGHVEKNWGQTFPGGHVWLQAFAPDNNSQLKTSAPFETFLDAVLAPMTKVDWEPACRESFVATAEVKVYEHVAWGILGTSNLVETQSFEFAALEFGEDLLKEGEESEANQNWSLEDPIF